MTAALSFHDLFLAHGPAVHRLALALCGQREAAEDLTSETFARALASRTPLRADSVRSWLLAIARNLWLSQQRRSDVRSAHDDIEHTDAPSTDPGPELRTLHLERLERVTAALAQLRDGDRGLLLLALVDGLDIPELAAALGIGRDHARVRLHRARQRLLQLITPEAP
jgi:RNA polymerase sigma-70 factor (ECF subfamily)